LQPPIIDELDCPMMFVLEVALLARFISQHTPALPRKIHTPYSFSAFTDTWSHTDLGIGTQ